MVFIYVLKCQNNKYYVGKTENPDYRLESHFSEGGSAWTKKYQPLQLYQLIPDQTDHDEQRVTQEYMEKYGIQNVRGGPWCKIDISERSTFCFFASSSNKSIGPSKLSNKILNCSTFSSLTD